MERNTPHKIKSKQNKMKYFSQICTEELIEVPCSHPDIEQVVSVVVDCEVVSLKAIDTMKGISYEGQHMSGKKLAVEIKLRQKILYVAEKDTQSIHIMENNFFQSAYIVIPCLIEGTDPAFLIKHKILQCRIDVEDVFVKNIDKRKVFKNLCLLVSAVLSPTYEICCSIHHNCKYSNIFMMHSDGTRAVQIISCEDYKSYKPLWSPLGREIAFISEERYNEMLNIYSVKNCSNMHLTVTSKFKNIGTYCWSSDATKLIFSGSIDGSTDIFSVNANNTGLKQLTYGNGMYESYKPKCSPCGQKVAFIRSVSGLADIWIMSLEGMDCIKLTSCGCVRHFDWSPDEERIVYICSKNDKPDQIDFFYVECMKNEEISIDAPLPHKNKVLFAPDGKSFAFIGSQLDSDDIYIYRLNDKKLINVTNNCENVKVSDFVWSADSDGIYFSANNLFYFNIYLISMEDKQKYQLTNTTASKIELNYRPRMC